MEKKNSNGSSSSSMVVRLPPGFRFHPTDEELVVQYLKRKVFSCPLPASIIPDLPHLYSNSDPWDLPGDAEQERYFFSTKEAKYPNGNRSNRATNSGYWKATGLDKKVLSSCKNTNQHHQVVVVGMKKTLVFYSGKPPHGSRTDWIMHEYRLLPHPAARPLPNWVLCRIFLKRRGAAAAAIAIASKEVSKKKNSSNKVVFYDFFLAHNNNSNSSPASSSSATCSVITDLSTNDDNDSSSTNTFPFSYFTYK